MKILGLLLGLVCRAVTAATEKVTGYKYLVGPYREFFDALTGNGATITAIMDDIVAASKDNANIVKPPVSPETLKFIQEVEDAYNEHREDEISDNWTHF